MATLKVYTLAISLSTLGSLEAAGDGDRVRPGEADRDLPRAAYTHKDFSNSSNLI